MTSSVVDASIVLRWYLPGEDAEAESRRLLDEYLRGQVRLMAPGLLLYEIINGVIVAGRRSPIPPGEDQRVVESFMELEIPLIDVSPFYERILWFSKTYQRSAYDGAYLALAENLRAPLITVIESSIKPFVCTSPGSSGLVNIKGLQVYPRAHNDLHFSIWDGLNN